MPRILGLDFGTKRVGAALSDPRGVIASPLEAYERRDRDRDARHYQALVREHEIERIVVGLPMHTGGEEGKLAAMARRWGAWLAEATGLPVVFHDERFSSAEADDILEAAGVRPPKRVGRRDMLAARILLQSYLDAGGPSTPDPTPPATGGNEGT